MSFFALGNVLMDLILETDADYVKKWDLNLDDQIMAQEKHESLFVQVAENANTLRVPGGCALNTTRVISKLAGKKSRVSVNFAGVTGADAVGDQIHNMLSSNSINFHRVKSKVGTGNTVALVTDGGKRSLVGPIEMADHFPASQLEAIEDKWKRAAFIFQASWFLLSPDGIKCAFMMAKHAAKSGQHFGLNLAAESLVHRFRDELVELMKSATFVFGNTVEYKAFAEAMNWNCPSMNDILMKMNELPYSGVRRRTLIITSGSAPTLMLFDGRVTSYPVNKISKEKVIDTTGAGDAFCGGFIFELLNDASCDDDSLFALENAIMTGHGTAKNVIQMRGCDVSKILPVLTESAEAGK